MAIDRKEENGNYAGKGCSVIEESSATIDYCVRECNIRTCPEEIPMEWRAQVFVRRKSE